MCLPCSTSVCFSRSIFPGDDNQLRHSQKIIHCSLSLWRPLLCSSSKNLRTNELAVFLLYTVNANQNFLRRISYHQEQYISKAAIPSYYHSSCSFSCTSNVEGFSEGQTCQAYVNGRTMPADPGSVMKAMNDRIVSKPLIFPPLSQSKKIFLIRHGLSSWNKDNRIQGSSDLSVLSDKGEIQIKKCRDALANLKFDHCFASPISRAKSSAELIWEGRKEPLIYLDNLQEVNLRFLEGMRNVDAKQQFPETYKAWREDPANFQIDGVYPVVELWEKAKKAWQDILSLQGEMVLVVTHKSILRALICTALGMGPERFRAIDIDNGGISVFSIDRKGEPMLRSLNMISHLYADEAHYLI